MVERGVAWCGSGRKAGKVRLARIGSAAVRIGKAGSGCVGYDPVRSATVRSGQVEFGWPSSGWVWRGGAQFGLARFGRLLQGKLGNGAEWTASVRFG